MGRENYGEEGSEMKNMVYWGLLVVFLPAMVFAQEKVEAPVWNAGDRWTFDREGPMEVTSCDAQCYAVKFSGGIFRKDASGIALFERSNLNVKYMLEGDRRKEYWDLRKKLLNFPVTLGKQWMDVIQYDALQQMGKYAVEISETFGALGWADVEVRAGKLRAIKLEYKCVGKWRGGMGWITDLESKAWYWYSPEVKNFVKCHYENGYTEPIDQAGKSESAKGGRGRADWELVSFELKK